MKTIKEIAEQIRDCAAEWQEMSWKLMQEGKTTAEKKKASADWNRSVSINAQVSEVIRREEAALNKNENPKQDNVRSGGDGGDINKTGGK